MAHRILFAPFGSEGDTNPLLWLAEGLAARGHQVEFLLAPHYGPLADQRGFQWHPLGDHADFLQVARDPAVWGAFRGPSRVIHAMVKSLPAYEAAYRAAGGRFDLVVTSSFALAAAALAEADKIPRLSLHLQPICLRSAFDCPVFLEPLAWLRTAPPVVKRMFFRAVDLFVWRLLEKPLNRFRRGLGLPALRRFYDEAVHGAEGTAALFPSWFAEPQPDWPTGLRQFGFPLSRERRPLPDEVSRFLEAGPPPIVWTHGSANYFIRDFQAAALRVSRDLGLRCLLVSLEPPTVTLPDTALHVSHVRFDDLFPRCRGVVHHGGIGTTAKCLAAGIPQVIVPRSHDQPDNAHRITRLGAGAWVPYRRVGSPALTQVVRETLTNPQVTTSCQDLQNRIASDTPLPALCDWAEALARSAR